jgi:hypothetical protein
MADTTFTPGTTITSAWLNDVNDNTYAAAPAPVGSFREALAQPTGDTLIGTQLNVAGSVAMTLDALINAQSILADELNILPTNSSAVNTAAINAYLALATQRPIKFGTGNYQFGDLNLTAYTPSFIGEGIENTTFTYTGTGVFLDARKAADAFLPRSPIYISGIKFDGTTKGAKTGISIKNRHDYAIRDCDFRNFSTLIQCEMAYIGVFDNVQGTACNTGWDIVGDTNRTAFRSCGVTDFATYGVRIRGGTFGSIALSFENCDWEFAAGAAVRYETSDVTTFRDCYIGDGVAGNIFEITTGKVIVDGGLVLWGTQAAFTNRIVEFVGVNPTTDERSLVIQNAKVSGSTHCGPEAEKMVKGTGMFRMEDCPIATTPYWQGGLKVITGNPLGQKSGFHALPSPSSNLFTFTGTGGATATSAYTNSTGGKKFTITSAGVGAAFVDATLSTNTLSTFGGVGIILVYESNSTWGMQLVTTVPNGAPSLEISSSTPGVQSLPSTAGVTSTAICFNQAALINPYAFLEFFRAAPANGDYIQIFEAYLFDYRQSGTNGTLYTLKNLYKPI